MRNSVLLLALMVFLSGFVTAGNEPARPDDGRGDYINVKLGGPNLNVVWQFHFTDDPNHQNELFNVDDFSRRTGDPYLFVSSQDAGLTNPADDFGVYVLEKGSIIEGRLDESFEDHIFESAAASDSDGCMEGAVTTNVRPDCSDRLDRLVEKTFNEGHSIINKCGDDGGNDAKSCTLNYNSGSNLNQDGDDDNDKDENQGIHQAYTLFGQSEIIVAAPGSAINREDPEDHSGEKNYYKYDFFLCDSSGKYNPGKVVYAYDDSSSQLRGWECTSDGPDLWEKLPQCNDGIENDDEKDGIDHPDSDYYDGGNNDPECSYLEDDSESTQDECTPVIQKEEVGGTNSYNAVYSGGTDGQGYCTGGQNDEYEETYLNWVGNDFSGNLPEPTVYRCNSENPGSMVNLTDGQTYDAPNLGLGVTICDSLVRDYRHDEKPGESGDTVYVAKYYPEQAYVDYLGSNLIKQSAAPNPVDSKTPSKFVDREGWTHAYMGLDAHSGFGENVILQAGAERQYATDESGNWEANGIHSTTHWFGFMGLADPDSDDTYEGEQNMSWKVENAGDGGGGEIDSYEQFPGGWYGRCTGSNNDWAPDTKAPGNWRCSDASVGSQTIIVNLFSIPEPDGKYVGFQINGSELEKWRDIYGVSPVSNNGDIAPLTVRAQCWAGELQTRPPVSSGGSTVGDLNNVFNISVQASGSPGNVDTLHAVAELPERSDPSAVSGISDSYSCIWGFQQRITDKDDKTTAMMDDIYVNTGTDSSGTVEPGIQDGSDVAWSTTEVGYVISGTEEGKVKTGFNVIGSPGQSTLQSRASSGYAQGADPWTHFPGPASTERRHPAYMYCQKYGGCS